MKQGDVWLVDLPFSGGHEQGGMRPSVILTETEPKTLILVPCTSNIAALRFSATVELPQSKDNGLLVNSIALLFQLRSIGKDRCIRKIGEVEGWILMKIKHQVKQLLAI